MSTPDLRKKLRKNMRRVRRKMGMQAVRAFGPAVLDRLSRTWTLEELNFENYERADQEFGGFFLSVWHGRMLLGMPRHGFKERWQVLVSPSKDGDIAERMLHGFGYETIRGSSSRNGAQAVRQVLGFLDGGGVVAVTPDGPRGPRHGMNPGVAWLARATGFPVLPAGFVCDRAWRMERSWDRFTIPKRGARVVLSYGPPIVVPRRATPEDMQAATDEIRLSMLQAELRGFERMGVPPDWPDADVEELRRVESERAVEVPRPEPRTEEPDEPGTTLESVESVEPGGGSPR